MKTHKHKLHRQNWPKIRQLNHGSSKPYLVDARPFSRERFRTLAEARTRAELLEQERSAQGHESLSFATKDRVEASACLARLRPFGRSLTDATTFYLAHLQSEASRQSSPTIAKTVEMFIAQRRADVERGTYDRKPWNQSRLQLSHLASVMGDLRIVDLDTPKVRSYLDSLNVAQGTKITVRAQLSRFCNYCREHQLLTTNPVEGIKLRMPRYEPTILSVEQTGKLLQAAAASKHASRAVPFTAISAFAGLRPREGELLDWADVDFRTATIKVHSHTSKIREGRWVAMPPNLIAWLQPYARKSGRITGTFNWRNVWQRVRRDVGWSATNPWPSDCLRHSYASYWLAAHENRNQLAELMGNSVEVIRRHYRKPVLKEDAHAYWNLLPT